MFRVASVTNSPCTDMGALSKALACGAAARPARRLHWHLQVRAALAEEGRSVSPTCITHEAGPLLPQTPSTSRCSWIR